MSILNRKKTGTYKFLDEKPVRDKLPSDGYGLENFVTSEYPMNNPENIEAAYKKTEEHLIGVIGTCDHHSSGSECDIYIDSQIDHTYSIHETAIANNENQIARILSAREMRKGEINSKIGPLQEKIDKLTSEISALEELEPQFCIHIGRKAFSIGLPITISAMLVDACVNYSFLSSILLSNAALLVITVICMSVCSDGCMWGLATYLNHKEEHFTHKPVFWSVCIGLATAFFLSVVTSFMIRYGSMDTTYGTINAAGEFVGKESYSLAEYGVTLITAFVTTATGIMSFAFSLDKNAFRISVRERKENELEHCLKELTSAKNELSLIEHAPDPHEWDERKRTAAEHQIEAMRIGLKLHCRKLMTEHLNDADFTEQMATSGEMLVAKCSPINTAFTDSTVSNVRLNKAS